MSLSTTRTLALLCLLPLGLAGAPPKKKAKPKAPTAAQMAALQAQVKDLTTQRDQLQDKVTSLDNLEAEYAAAQKSRDAFKEEAWGLRRELDQMKGALSENQHGSDAILDELRKAKEGARTAEEENAKLKKALEEAQAKLAAPTAEGSLLPLGRDVTPAQPINLKRVTPSRHKVDRGVVVINVLVSETGEPLDVRLIQGLPEKGEWAEKAQDSCLEAAKKLVFDPARTQEGVRVRVWQGVGFYLD